VALFLFENSYKWSWPRIPGERLAMVLLPIEIIIWISPLIALIGIAWLFVAIRNREPKLPPLISTLIGITPGIFLLIANALSLL
jgi:hypothetical protein